MNAPLHRPALHRAGVGGALVLAFILCLVSGLSCPMTAAVEKAAPPPELDLIPRDGFGFVSVRVADLWQSDAAKGLRDLLGKQEGRPLEQFEKRFGVKLSDIERVTLLFPSVPAHPERMGPPLVVVTAAKPYDRAKLLTAMRAVSPVQFERGFRGRPALPATSIEKPVIEKRPDAENRPAVPQEKPKEVKEEIQNAAEADDPPARDRDGRDDFKPDLSAPYYHIEGDADSLLYLVNDRTVLLALDLKRSNGDTVLSLLGQLLRRDPKGPLAAAIAAADSKHAIVAGLNVAALAKRLPADLPLALQVFQPLLAARGATLTADAGDELQLALRFEFADADAAKRADQTAQALLTLARQMLPALRKELKKDKEAAPLLALLDQAEAALKDAKVEQAESQVRVAVKMKSDLAWSAALAAAVAQVQLSSARARSQNNLKQIGLALHAYNDAYNRLPFVGVGVKGMPGQLFPQANMHPNLSWRVAILPFIEQNALYQQFKLDEPWDSPHNKKLIPLMPQVYAPLGGAKAEKGMTFYQIFTGPAAMQNGMRIPASFPDGTSNTIFVVEAAEPVIWTKPQDIPFDPKKPVPKLGALFGGDFNVVLADGSVRFIRRAKISDETLRYAIMPADGMPLGSDW